MSTDRELLELAAKASGAHAVEWAEAGQLLSDKGGFVQFIGHGKAAVWNPLTDDGDALRLAVKLGIYVGTRTAEVWRYDKEIAHIFEDGGDEYQATRRAIVRAAAEIGKHSAPSKEES